MALPACCELTALNYESDVRRSGASTLSELPRLLSRCGLADMDATNQPVGTRCKFKRQTAEMGKVQAFVLMFLFYPKA